MGSQCFLLVRLAQMSNKTKKFPLTKVLLVEYLDHSDFFVLCIRRFYHFDIFFLAVA